MENILQINKKDCWIPLATLNTQIIFFLNVFSDEHEVDKRWRPQTICLRASIVFIQTNPAKIPIYRQLLLATQIQYLMVFGLPTSNTEYCQIPPNTTWELALTEGNHYDASWWPLQLLISLQYTIQV